ncbi:hypothetical protein SKAU_G00198260 [Synaphobranchus kaupii]|uniref:C-C motif chemokine n=1 Tax=Synaphobranchus kaupii TaxID=118154 RepID=A0A9Q1FF85_SYNKA|nr:hypothetical protein SKAU_G00198260 [Synaphobranchus kaupii]
MMALPAVFLCVALLLPSPAPGQASGPVTTCCLTTTNTRIRVDLLEKYYIQKKGLCPVDAVVFTTVRGVTICSDPSKLWTERGMVIVDSRRTAHLTTDTTSLLPSTQATSAQATASMLNTKTVQ